MTNFPLLEKKLVLIPWEKRIRSNGHSGYWSVTVPGSFNQNTCVIITTSFELLSETCSNQANMATSKKIHTMFVEGCLIRLIGNSQCIHHAITYFPRFEYHFVVALNDSENGSFKNIWRVCGSIFTNQSRLALIWNTFIMITTMVSEVISLFCNFICNFAVNENGVAVGCIRRGRLVITFQSATSFYNDWAISALLFKKTEAWTFLEITHWKLISITRNFVCSKYICSSFYVMLSKTKTKTIVQVLVLVLFLVVVLVVVLVHMNLLKLSKIRGFLFDFQ